MKLGTGRDDNVPGVRKNPSSEDRAHDEVVIIGLVFVLRIAHGKKIFLFRKIFLVPPFLLLLVYFSAPHIVK